MQSTDKTVELNPRVAEIVPADLVDCHTCALCSGSCPVAGVDGFDPRTVVRLTALGRSAEVVAARWPWICTLCGKCEHVCPMQVDITGLIRAIRGRRRRADVPGILHKGLAAALKTGNNLSLPTEDYLFILQDVGEEIAAEPGFEDFTVPVDKHGANILTTLHNKLLNTHTEHLKHWWKIFHAAGENWTVVSENWEGTNWGFFTGDDAAMRTMVGRIVAHMRRLEAQNLLCPE